MNLKMKSKRLFLTLLGTCVLGVGIALSVRSRQGGNILDLLFEAISIRTGFSIGRINFFGQMIMALITLILYPKNIGIGTVLSLFLTQFPIDFVYSILGTYDSLIINMILISVGTVFVGLGAGLIVYAGLGMSTYEALLFAISNRTKIKYVYLKYVFDGVFLLTLILLNGTVGIGTIMAFLFIGRLIVFFDELFRKNNFLNLNSEQ